MAVATEGHSHHPYLKHRLASTVDDEQARRASRQDSVATIKPRHVGDGGAGAVQLPTGTKENDWLGFCPSAIKMQNGDRKGALKKRTDYHDSFSASGVTTYTCATKGCVFQGHISVDFVWKAVQKDDELGLKIKWAFLAKSHLKTAMVTGRQYLFQCPICIYTQGAHDEGRIWKGVEIFLEHIATHRGKPIPVEVLLKLNIINDHEADEKEDYDLNLYPTSAFGGQQQLQDFSASTGSQSSLSLSRTTTGRSFTDSAPWGRKQSSQVDIASGLARIQTYRTDRADSVVGAARGKDVEPWSEGLSSFKVDREEDYLSPDF